MTLGALQFTVPADSCFPLGSAERKETIFRQYKLGNRVIDQKENPWCVPASIVHLLEAEPIKQTYSSLEKIYNEARERGKVPKSASGSPLNHALDFLKSENLIKNYHFSVSEERTGEYINSVSPVLINMAWFQKMFDPAKDGKVSISGKLAGFHCVLCYAYDGLKGRYYFRSSWGREWGVNGNFYLSAKDLEKLFKEGSVAAAVIE